MQGFQLFLYFLSTGQNDQISHQQQKGYLFAKRQKYIFAIELNTTLDRVVSDIFNSYHYRKIRKKLTINVVTLEICAHYTKRSATEIILKEIIVKSW